MKNIPILIISFLMTILLVGCSSTGRSDYGYNDKQGKAKGENRTYNKPSIDSSKIKIFKIEVRNNINQDSVFLFLHGKYNDNITVINDTIIKINQDISSVQVKLQGFKDFKKINEDNKEFLVDIIGVKLFLDSIENSRQMVEALKKQKQDLIWEEKRIDLLSRTRQLMDDALKDMEYYNSKLSGKSSRYIADFLYDAGFGRRYDASGSNFYTIYGIRQNYDNGDFYDIDIYEWYSYGYGRLYLDMKSTVFLKGYGFIISGNDKTSLYNILIQ